MTTRSRKDTRMELRSRRKEMRKWLLFLYILRSIFNINKSSLSLAHSLSLSLFRSLSISRPLYQNLHYSRTLSTFPWHFATFLFSSLPSTSSTIAHSHSLISNNTFLTTHYLNKNNLHTYKHSWEINGTEKEESAAKTNPNMQNAHTKRRKKKFS